MTPAVNAAKKAKVPFQLHQYQHDPSAASYGLEAAEALGQDPARVFKTLLAADDGGQLYVAVVPVIGQLDLKALAKAVKAKRLAMADPKVAEKATGYVVGGISPLGQKKRLTLVLDASAEAFETICVSGGRRGLEIELAPADLLTLTGGRFAAVGST
ncbi:Cys-tRNA(Pro) deacylase [Ferrimonas sediminicola]|uniref:Cys-tRNA(Pro)/Cys-tRNA(Cys) deacylase n=1 Tax=Ferrimonas sediminicola TaxID=2569538 RepID=A0A4U1BD21_9GAMM|nr:Cys-tRNA(Pro) deacylase [Ferrimonas sediminicola]TKB48969.1 Cys-tRNA(Pro) deacylase [Ferrimonas sediminicola]